MKVFKKLLSLTGICLSCALPAFSPGYCNIDVEYLYLKPSIDDTYFVIVSDAVRDQPLGDKKNNDFGFHSGFRMGAEYIFCGDFIQALQLYYSHLSAAADRTVSGDFLWATRGSPLYQFEFHSYPGLASAHTNLLYQRVDGFWSKELLCRPDMNLHLQTGLEYAYLRLNVDYRYLSTGGNSLIIYNRCKTVGVGPQVGIDFEYALCNCSWGSFAFRTRTTGSILASTTSASEYINGNPEITAIFNVPNERMSRIIPAFHTRLGLAYETLLSCITTSLEIGYEFNTYIRAFASDIYSDDVASAFSFSLYNNIDLQGLYLAANFGF